jgi:hypothetical protein
MTDPRSRALAFLLSRSADTVPHRHGTLLDHLLATEVRLRAWGASEELCRAGLCHASYGTDGFAPHLLAVAERALLAAAMGTEVEETIYFYAACDRSYLYPQLSRPGSVRYRDRFTDVTFEPSATGLRDFVDLTLANELDVAFGPLPSSGPAAAPPWIGPLVDQMVDRASPGAGQGARQALESARGRTPSRR